MKKYEFTQEQIDYIIKNWGKKSPFSMKNKFGCTWYAVCKVAEAHGLEIPTANNWSDEEIKTLQELSKKYSYKEIAKIMGKSENAIYLKARKLNLTLIQERRKWTEEEEDYLRDNWGIYPMEVIAKNLKRTVYSVHVKAVRMHLGARILNVYDVLTIRDIMDALHVTRDRITTWKKYGLKVKKRGISKERAYYVVTINDLFTFLESHQDLFDASKIEEGIFGIEPNWLKEKRKKDRLEKPKSYRKWSEVERKELESLHKMGKTKKEIAKKLDRTEWAIGHQLNNLGYSSIPLNAWGEEEIRYLEENYRNMTYEELGNHLGRTKKGVEGKLCELGLKKKVKIKKM